MLNSHVWLVATVLGSMDIEYSHHCTGLDKQILNKDIDRTTIQESGCLGSNLYSTI